MNRHKRNDTITGMHWYKKTYKVSKAVLTTIGVKRITIILMTMKPASLNKVTIKPTLDLKNMISSSTIKQIT